MTPNKDIHKSSFNLDSIEKRNIYTVPDKYFDGLQASIQGKVAEKKPFYQLPFFNLGLKLALPVAFILVFAIYSGFFKSELLPVENLDMMLSEVTTEDLVAYLDESEISAEEIMDNVSFDLLLEDETDFLNSDDINDTDINDMIDELELYNTEI